MKKTEFMGWKNCIEFESGNFRIIVTTDIGPRIIGAFLGDSDNLVYVDPATAGSTADDKEWHLYGGHRLWHSPEELPRTYVPDNKPAEAKETEDGIMFSSGIESGTGIGKSYTIKPLGKERFRITHRIKNHNMWDIEIAAWALTVMAPGGTGIIPQPQGDKTALLPNRYLTIWPYTNMADKRVTWGDKYTLVKQDTTAKSNFKIGINCEDNWIAYANKGVALRKRFEHLADAEYPDNGCSIELFTNSEMLEIETLSPLYLLAPEEEIVHIEEWEALKVGDIVTEKDAAQYLN